MAEFDGNQPEDGLLLFENRGWQVFDRGSINGWQQVKLIAKVRQKKANFHLAFNGDRLAMGKDAIALNTYYPDVLDWLLDGLKPPRLIDGDGF